MVRGEGVLPGTNEVNKCCKTRARPGLPHSGYSRHAAASQRPALLLRAEVAPGPVRPNHTCLRRASAGCLHLAHAAQVPLPILTFGDPRPACGEREAPPQLRHTPPGSTPRLAPQPRRAPYPGQTSGPRPPRQGPPPPINGAVWAAGPAQSVEAGLLLTQLRPRLAPGSVLPRGAVGKGAAGNGLRMCDPEGGRAGCKQREGIKGERQPLG